MDPRERDERKSKQRHTQALLDKAYDEIVSSQLERLKSKKTYTENDEDAYRLKLEADRDRAAKKRQKVMSAEHEELARTTGLSGHVVALMASGDHDNSDNDDASRKRHHKRKSRRRTYDSEQDDSLGSEDKNVDREGEKARKKKDYKKRKRDRRRSSPDDHKDRDHDGKRLSGENDSSKERYNRDNTDQYISSKHRDDDDQSSSDPSRKKTRKRRKRHSHKRK